MYVQDIVLNWNGGSPYKWAIPSSISSGEYYLYAAGNNLRNINQKEVIDFSDRTFTITSPSTSPSPSLTVAPIIPSITSIQSPANPVGIVDSGSRAVIYGTGLKGKLTIKLGAQEPRFVTINSNTSDTSAEFIVPSQNFSSVVSVIVTNSSGKTSNFYEIRINAAVVSSTPTPVASIAPVVTATPTPSPSATQTPSPTATTDVVDRREAIRQLYLTLLRREPDAAGLDYWVSTSYTIDQVKQQFLNGAEYQNLIRTTANPSSSASPSVSASAPVFRATLWDAVKVLFGF